MQEAYDAWKENEKWKALAIHHNMTESLGVDGGGHAGKGGEELDETHLPKILKALKIVRRELTPPDTGQDPTKEKPSKPTGAKRVELVKKIDFMTTSYEKVGSLPPRLLALLDFRDLSEGGRLWMT